MMRGGVASEVSDHEELMRNEQCGGLPPGFRFHPTDEELLTFYLASKVFYGASFSGVDIAEVDLSRCEPWDLPEEAKMGKREWYMYSMRDRKYPTGVRTNRATGAGYWKATGKDRQIMSTTHLLLGLKKTLVFYTGRAPRGLKTMWVMHEYRLHYSSSFSISTLYMQDEWVICRIFHKAAVHNNKRSPATTTAPALLDTTTLFLPFQNHQQNNHLSAIQPSYDLMGDVPDDDATVQQWPLDAQHMSTSSSSHAFHHHMMLLDF